MTVSPSGGGGGGDDTPMKPLIAIFLMLLVHAAALPNPVRYPAPADTGESPAGAVPDAEVFSPGLDSLERVLACLEVARAEEEVARSDFWHRLIPRISFESGIGVHDVAFADPSGSLVIPKDSYRITFSLSLSGLLDGSACTLARLRLREMQTRYAVLLRKQSLSRRSLERKKNEFSAELASLREELRVRESDVACRELLFAQGRADFHALSGARIDLIRLHHSCARLAAAVRAVESALAEYPPP